MRTVFSLFDAYEDCETAVDELLDEGFKEDEMNVIVDEEVAKTNLDVKLDRVDVKATEELGEEARGLDVLLGVEQPVAMPRVGDVYAAGKLATILAKTAAAPDTGGLREALIDFDVSEPAAGAYEEAVSNGALLFWVRSSDERASEAASILRDHNGINVTSYAG